MVDPGTRDELSQVLRDAIAELSALGPEDSYDEKSLAHHPQRKGFADLSLGDPLMRLAESTSNSRAYHVATMFLGDLAKNTSDLAVCDFIADQFQNATPAWKRERAAETISSGVLGNNIVSLAPVLCGLKPKYLWFVLRGLQHCDRPEIEPYLLEVLERPEERYMTYWAIQALENVGTRAALPVLRRHCNSRIVDIAIVASHRYAEIARSDGCEVYHELLAQKGLLSKTTAACAIAKYCGSNGIPAVIKRIKSITTRPGHEQTSESVHHTELIILIKAIERHREEHADAVAKLYVLLRNRWEKRAKSERRWLIEHVPEFADMVVEPPPKPVESITFEDNPQEWREAKRWLAGIRKEIDRALRRFNR